ncbi:MAG: hypothetical protein CL583_18050 [Alteromonadaceae bacterium]|nr:hypothetical protein [Alteromonadaceae bacterium]|tara:strand:- start:3297 stop:3821 length:525 start_codon:yes stop_codon:yes gene_type:complete
MALPINPDGDKAQIKTGHEQDSQAGRFVPTTRASRSTKALRYRDGNVSAVKFEGIEGVRTIRRGEDFAALEALKKALDINDSEVAHVVGISGRTLERRRRQGRLEPKDTDRVASLFSVLEDAVALFEGDEEKARRWLRTPVRGLANQTPLALLDTETGSRMVRDLIGRLEHGVL